MKKALSVCLVLALLLGVLSPFAAFAAQPEEHVSEPAAVSSEADPSQTAFDLDEPEPAAQEEDAAQPEASVQEIKPEEPVQEIKPEEPAQELQPEEPADAGEEPEEPSEAPVEPEAALEPEKTQVPAQPEEPVQPADQTAEGAEEPAVQPAGEPEENAPEETPVIVTEAESFVPARALAGGSGAGNHTTADSGPQNPHTPKTYVWDLSKDYTLPQGYYSNYPQSLGILYPGDTLRILPSKDDNPNGKGHHGVPGISLGGRDIVKAGEKIGPMRVTKATAYGTPKEQSSVCKQYVYITELTVEDAPVMLQQNGGGTSWATSSPGENNVPQDSWDGISVGYIELPKYVPVQYLYAIPGKGNLTDWPVSYYGHDKDNPEVIWMEDVSLEWNPETAQYEVIGPTFQIYRPFTEEYSFVGFANSSHDLLSVKCKDDQCLVNGQWEYTHFYFTGLQTAFNTKFTNGPLTAEVKPVQIICRYSQRYGTPETMALDANGGTIGGYPSRLIDLESSKYFMGQEGFPASYLPTRANYTFTGWYADKACTKLIASADLTPDEMLSKLKSDSSNNRYSPKYQYIQYLDDPNDVYWHYSVYAGWKSNGAQPTQPSQPSQTSQTKPVSLSGAAVAVAAQSYTGRELKPGVTVKVGSATLKSGTDYTLSYRNNINAGTATVTVTGKGGYTGSVSQTFQINKINQTLTASAASSLIAGKSATITAKGTGAITYTSSNTAVATVSANGVVTGKAPGTVTITVKAAGNGNYNAASRTVKMTVSCAAPALSKAENVNGGVKLTWGKVAGAEKYRVFYKTGKGGWKKLADTASTSYTWKKAKKGTKYSFTVRCVTKDGKGITSDYDKKGKTLTYIPAPVLSKVQNTKAGVKLTWKKSAGAAKYRVLRKTGKGKWVKVGDTTKLTFVDKKAKKGVKYTYTVRCITKNGKSYTSGYNTKGLSIKRK